MQGAVHMTYWNGFVIFDPSSSHRTHMIPAAGYVQPGNQIMRFIRVPEAMSSAPCRRLPKCRTARPTCSQAQLASSIVFQMRPGYAVGLPKQVHGYKDNRTAATVAPPQQVTANSDCRLPRASRRGRPSCIAASRMSSSGVDSLVGVNRSGVVRK